MTGTQSSTTIGLVLGTPTTVLTLAVTTTAGQSVKLDSMADVEITTTALIGATQYTLTYDLERDGTPIATVTREEEVDQALAIARVFGDIPNETWLDAPAAGAHTYDLVITVTGTNVTAANVLTRALNAVVFGP